MQIALLLFIVVISLAIGFFLGLLLLSVDSPLAKKITKNQEEDLPDDALPSPSSPESSPAEVDGNKPTPNAKKILIVWHEEGQPPVYEWNGNFCEKDALPDQLLHIITRTKEVVSIPANEADPKTLLIETSEPIKEREEEDGELLSVIGEIDYILQKRLENSPLAERGIHLMENQKKEIRIWVGLDSYDSIDDIPDLEVRDFIHAAVKEWENQNE